MFKKLLLLTILMCSTINASNFRDGMIAFRKYHFIKAKQLFEKAIKKDKVVSASYMLGRMYLHGKGVDVNFDKAIKLLEYAYSHGNIPAGCHLSEAHIRSNKKVYLAGEGVKRGMAINLPYCEKVFMMWRAYNSDLATFPSNLRKQFLKK